MHPRDGFVFGPVNAFGDHRFRIELNAAQYPFFKTQVAAFVDQMAHMEIDRFSAEHLFFKFIQVNDHLLYHIFSHPVEEELADARRLFTGASAQTDLPELIRLTLLGQRRTGQHALAAADTGGLFFDRFAVLQRQAAYRVVTTGLHAGAAADTTIGSEAHFRHANNSQIGH